MELKIKSRQECIHEYYYHEKVLHLFNTSHESFRKTLPEGLKE